MPLQRDLCTGYCSMVIGKHNKVQHTQVLKELQLQEIEHSLIVELLNLFAVFCWVDGVVSDEEKTYVKKYLDSIYPTHFSENLNTYFLTLLSSEATHEPHDSKRIKARFKYEERFYILFKLYELAYSDDIVDSEKQALESVRKSMGVYAGDAELIDEILEIGRSAALNYNGSTKIESLPKTLFFDHGEKSESSSRFLIIRIRAQLFCYSLCTSLETKRRSITERRLIKLTQTDQITVDGMRISVDFIKTIFKCHGKKLPFSSNELEHSEDHSTGNWQVEFRRNGITITPEGSSANEPSSIPKEMGFLHVYDQLPVLFDTMTNAQEIKRHVHHQESVKIGNCFIYDIEVFDNLDDDWYCLITRKGNELLIHKRSCPHKIVTEEGKWTGGVLHTTKNYVRILGKVIFWDDKQQTFKATSGVPKSIDVRRLKHLFQDKSVGLDDISFSAHRGDLIAIIGPSGSGKSTLFKALNSAKPPAFGEINVEHQNGLTEIDLPSITSYTPQDDLLKADLTVYENLLYNCRLRYVHSHVDHHRIVNNVLGQIGLYNKRHLKAGEIGNKTLSGGERKRLNIGLELLEEKDIFLFDEPTTGLSSKDSDKIITILKGLSNREKIVMAIVHQPAATLLNRFNKLLLLDKGGVLIYFGEINKAFEYFEQYTDTPLQEKLNGRINEPDALLEIVEQPMRDLDGRPFSFRKYSPQFWAHEFQKSSD